MTDTSLNADDLKLLNAMREVVRESPKGRDTKYVKYGFGSSETATCFYLDYTSDDAQLVYDIGNPAELPSMVDTDSITGPGCVFGHVGAKLDPEHYKNNFLIKEGSCVSTTFLFRRPEHRTKSMTDMARICDAAQQFQDDGGTWGVALTLIEVAMDADITYPEVLRNKSTITHMILHLPGTTPFYSDVRSKLLEISKGATHG